MSKCHIGDHDNVLNNLHLVSDGSKKIIKSLRIYIWYQI